LVWKAHIKSVENKAVQHSTQSLNVEYIIRN
jgi:hypothetical protein